MSTIIRLYPFGRLANRMMQLMFALAVQRLARMPVSIEGYDLPEWQLTKPAFLFASPSDLPIGDDLMRATAVAAVIDRYQPKYVDLFIAALRVGNLLPKIEYQDVFPLGHDEGLAFGENDLLIHIRAGDVATLSHPLYGPLPIGYYRHLIASTGLQPVFIGEIDESPYCRMLRVTFPRAAFITGRSARDDFQTIRRAHHIALGVSTFSWVASYLSNAQTIHVPVAGMFDPRERPDIDLLATHDQRYRFYDIPPCTWRNRYSDIRADQATFCPLTTAAVDRLRKVAMLKTAIRLGRIRLGMERRLACNLILEAKRKLLATKTAISGSDRRNGSLEI